MDGDGPQKYHASTSTKSVLSQGIVKKTRAFGARWCRALAGPRREKKVGWCAPAVGISFSLISKKRGAKTWGTYGVGSYFQKKDNSLFF